MARGSAGNVHVGKAAALIVAAVLLGVIVLRDHHSSGFSEAEARAATQRFLTQTTLPATTSTTAAVAVTHAPEQVKVVAINASGTSGKAAQATTKLHNAGYNALQPGNATASVTASHPASVVYVVIPGYERDARDVAALFGLPDSAIHSGLPNPPPSPDIQQGVNLVVLVGTGITL